MLHVLSPVLSHEERKRRKRHLDQARASLSALGVEAPVKFEEEPALERILQKAEEFDHDLIVVGAPAPLDPTRMLRRDLGTAVAARTNRPVLIVPMRE